MKNLDNGSIEKIHDELRQKMNKAAENWLLEFAKTLKPDNEKECLEGLCKWYEASTKETRNEKLG